MAYTSNEDRPFGSATWADPREAQKLGMLKPSRTASYIGHLNGRPLRHHGEGGAVMIAGARAGKGACILVQNLIDGMMPGRSLVVLSTKGDLPAITLNQTGCGKAVYVWNLEERGGLPCDSLNPFESLTRSSRTLEADIKTIVQGLIPGSGGKDAAYFEGRARLLCEASLLALVARDGGTHLPALYDALSAAMTGGAEWKIFADALSRTGNPLCLRVRREIELFHEDAHGAMKDVMGEVGNALASLSDPNLRRAVSPPFSLSLADDLCAADKFANLFIVCEPERMISHAPVIKALLSALFVIKSRKPSAPKQDWILDECALLGGFDLVPKLFSYGAGIGIRPFAVFQSPAQMEALGAHAKTIILSSAQVQLYFGIRDFETARAISDMIGAQTLEIADLLVNARAAAERQKLMSAILNGADPFAGAAELKKLTYESGHKRLMRRQLVTPDELLHLPPDKLIVFVDGLSGPLLASRTPYWRQRWSAGKYLPDPYHPPLGSVLIQTLWGQRRRKVITESVPERFAHLPQYARGSWSYVEGTI